MKDDPPARCNGIHHEVAVADRAATRKHDEIRRRTLVERLHERVHRILRRTSRLGHTAVRRHDRSQREPVHIVYVSIGQRLAWLDHLVACRQDGDPGLRKDFDIDAADGRERADAPCRDQFAGPDHAIASINETPKLFDPLMDPPRRRSI